MLRVRVDDFATRHHQHQFDAIAQFILRHPMLRTPASAKGGVCKIRTNVPVVIEGVKVGSKKDTNGYVTTLDSIKGKTYIIKTDKNN